MKILKTIAVLLVLTATAQTAILTWDSRDHSIQSIRGFPKWQGKHIQFKPALADGAGSNDYVIGPFDISKNPVYPQAVTVLLNAQAYGTNNDVNAYLVFEVKLDSIEGLVGAPLIPASINDSTWIKLDSILINNSQDSTYPGLSTLNGGDALIFDFPPAVMEYRFFWDVVSGGDSLESIDMYMLLIE